MTGGNGTGKTIIDQLVEYLIWKRGYYFIIFFEYIDSVTIIGESIEFLFIVAWILVWYLPIHSPLCDGLEKCGFDVVMVFENLIMFLEPSAICL